MRYWVMETNIYRVYYEHLEDCWILNIYRNSTAVLIAVTKSFWEETINVKYGIWRLAYVKNAHQTNLVVFRLYVAKMSESRLAKPAQGVLVRS